VTKDRAAPFSRKHRRYWIPVTGGMVVIGLINVLLGLSSYHAPQDPARIDLGIGGLDPDLIPASALPIPVVRGFVARYPHTIARGAKRDGSSYVIEFPPGAAHHHATFAANGSFVSED
jgi:hypothetical protein